MATSTSKIDECEVCGTDKAKYTCPKCEVRTCCLNCVNIHKKELECDGIRDKTKFIPLKSFTDLDVLSDYRLLEEVGRTVDQLKRDPTRRYTRQNDLPMHLNKLRTAAFRRKVNLQFMPPNFGRHKSNTTFFKWKGNELFWRIEWIFPQAEHIKWTTERALETTRLAVLLEEILDPISTLEDKNNIEELNLRINLNDRLQYYRAAGLPGLKVLLKAERVVKSDSKFYELDMSLTLKENLENKTIIEFPTIYVVLKDHSDIYEIIDSDTEDNVKTESERMKEGTYMKRKRSGNEANRQNHNSSVNYFFNADLSESDDESAINRNRQNNCSSGFSIPNYDQLIKMEQ